MPKKKLTEWEKFCKECPDDPLVMVQARKISKEEFIKRIFNKK